MQFNFVISSNEPGSSTRPRISMLSVGCPARSSIRVLDTSMHLFSFVISRPIENGPTAKQASERNRRVAAMLVVQRLLINLLGQ